MPAMKGVQGPGIMKRSDTTMIREPVMKPAAGPRASPVAIDKVSVNPTFIKIPNSGPGEPKAMLPKTILATAPIATMVAVRDTSLDLFIAIWLDNPSITLKTRGGSYTSSGEMLEEEKRLSAATAGLP